MSTTEFDKAHNIWWRKIIWSLFTSCS